MEMVGNGDGVGPGNGSIVTSSASTREIPPQRPRNRSPGATSKDRNGATVAAHGGPVGSDGAPEDGRPAHAIDNFPKDAQEFDGGSSYRVGGGRGSVVVDMGTMTAHKGMEPAVKGCGVMTTATFLQLVTFSVMIFYGVQLWTMRYDSSSGRLCSFSDKNACVTSPASKVLLTLARTSAGPVFSGILCCILSKCYATRYFLHHSWLALVVSFEPAHELHTYFGTLTLLFGVLHGCAHMALTISEGREQVLLKNPLYLSGMAGLAFVVPTALPMMLPYLKKWLTYEFRKVLHMLFIPFMVAMCFHGGALRAMCAVLLVVYSLDRMYFTTRMAGFLAEAVGGWTQELFRLSLEDLSVPIWITAAQPSVLEKSIFFDNVVLVCTGAGITPAACLVDMFSKKKNVHLIWMSREAGMIAMFEKQLRRVKSTVHLTGTQSAQTKQLMIDLLAPSKGEVVATTAVASQSQPPSSADLATLGGRSDIFTEGERSSYRGELKEEHDEDRREWTAELATRDGWDDSLGGVSAGEPGIGLPAAAKADRGSSEKGSRFHHQRCSSLASASSATSSKKSRGPRAPYGHPISINFGRPDIEKFIAETIRGSAVEEKWAATLGNVEAQTAGTRRSPAPSPKVGKAKDALQGEVDRPRLNSHQRVSKRDLMSADLSVIASAAKESASGLRRFENTTDAGVGGEDGGGTSVVGDPRTWLVLFCGGNPKVEKAVATACGDLGVTWRKEFFASW
eukprot:g5731.t1